MFSPPALGPPGGLGAGTKDTLASLGHYGKRTSPPVIHQESLSPASAGLSSFARRMGFSGTTTPSIRSNLVSEATGTGSRDTGFAPGVFWQPRDTRANAWRGLYWFPHGIQSFSPSFAHVSHFRQFSASCAFASSSVEAHPSLRMMSSPACGP
jgi:hypothetical protein